MTGPILIGLCAAFFASLPSVARALLERQWGEAAIRALGGAPAVLAIGVGGLLAALIIARRSREGKIEAHALARGGVADMMAHIHLPAKADPPEGWLGRGALSLLLSFFGGWVGPEGAGAEVSHALALQLRRPTDRWFEHRRRTDAACAFAAGISAAFGTPFAGMLMAMELGMGGRTVSAALASLVACVASRYFLFWSGAPALELGSALRTFRVTEPREWFSVILIALILGVASAFLVQAHRVSRREFRQLVPNRRRAPAVGAIVATLLLAGLALGQPWARGLPQQALESVLWLQHTPREAALLLATEALSLVIVLAAFGSSGVFWPLLAVGGCLGFVLNQNLPAEISLFAPLAGLIGAVALWGAALGIPLAASALALELTGNVHLLLPCLLAAFVAQWISSRLMRSRTWIERDLEEIGVSIVDGRDASILRAIHVGDAMVRDHDVIREHEPVASIHAHLIRSRYVFLPVVDETGAYLGLVTTDMVTEALDRLPHGQRTDLIEAKDLLYRSGMRVPSIRESDALITTGRLFDRYACLPVVDGTGRATGLLFAHSVRVAYDQEMTRRSLRSL